MKFTIQEFPDRTTGGMFVVLHLKDDDGWDAESAPIPTPCDPEKVAELVHEWAEIIERSVEMKSAHHFQAYLRAYTQGNLERSER